MPHVEDILVARAELVGQQPDLRNFLLKRIKPWQGTPQQTFEALVRPTYMGHGYINEIMGIPSVSAGYWLPGQPLTQEVEGAKVYYRYPRRDGVRLLKYVGFAPPISRIPAGALVRISLARWWRQEDSDIEERCYLQLSGWYL